MIGALHQAAAAMLVSQMPRYEERTFVGGRQVIARGEAAIRYHQDSEEKAARWAAESAARQAEWERLRIHRLEQDKVAKVAAEEKRRRKNERHLAQRVREIAVELESLKPVEIPKDLRDRYGVRIVNGDVVVPVMVGRMLVEASEAQGVVWREEDKGERS